MSNMSYCRFQNTAQDLRDCLWAMQVLLDNDGEDEYGEKISESEYRAMQAIIEMSVKITNYFNEDYFLEMTA